MEGPAAHAKGRKNERRVHAYETKVQSVEDSNIVSSYLLTKNLLCFQTRKWFSVSDSLLYVHEKTRSQRKSPFIECDLRLCDLTVMDARNRFILSPPVLRAITFTARNKSEFRHWVRVLADVIYDRPGKRRVPAGVVRMVSVNPRCADCKAPCPYFLVLNLGILVCKQCATIHRTIGRQWKVQSLAASPELWRASWATVVTDIGNINSNSIWEADVGDCNKPHPGSSVECKQCWIYAKYLSRTFINRHLMLDRKDPSERLFEAACRGSAKDIVTHFASGANLKWIDHRGNTALHVAASKSYRVCLRLLLTHDVDVWARNNDGLTPRDLARNQSVADMLIQAEQRRPRLQPMRFIRGCRDADTESASNTARGHADEEVIAAAAAAFADPNFYGYIDSDASARTGDDGDCDSDDDGDSDADNDSDDDGCDDEIDKRGDEGAVDVGDVKGDSVGASDMVGNSEGGEDIYVGEQNIVSDRLADAPVAISTVQRKDGVLTTATATNCVDNAKAICGPATRVMPRPRDKRESAARMVSNNLA